jgi:hypothetical protein
LAYIHGCDEEALIEDDLQVTRLKSLLRYIGVAWITLAIATPLVSVPREVRDWPVWSTGFGEYVDLLLACGGLSVAGAVGGIISGMFGIRDSRAALGQYRTSMLKLGLKPLVGALAALTVYLFLSAGVISGVDVTSGGVYVSVAFLAGFSERYFLRVLRAQEADLAPNAGAIADSASATLPSARSFSRATASRTPRTVGSQSSPPRRAGGAARDAR